MYLTDEGGVIMKNINKRIIMDMMLMLLIFVSSLFNIISYEIVYLVIFLSLMLKILAGEVEDSIKIKKK